MNLIRLILILIVSIITSKPIFARNIEGLKQVLASKDFKAFKKYNDKLIKSKNGTYATWNVLRDITYEFQEGGFYYSESIENSTLSKPYVVTYKVELLTSSTKIVSYTIYKWYQDNSIDTLDRFKDETLYDSMKSSFKRIFKTDLNEKELFTVEYVYGNRCGNFGSAPKGLQIMDEWVNQKNKIEILKWLKSTNTEKQIYAVNGLIQLRNRGFQLSNEEIEIMRYIIQKKGTIITCGGSRRYTEKIKRICKTFKL